MIWIPADTYQYTVRQAWQLGNISSLEDVALKGIIKTLSRRVLIHSGGVSCIPVDQVRFVVPR